MSGAPLRGRQWTEAELDAKFGSARPSFSVIEGEGANVAANISSADPLKYHSAEVLVLPTAGSPKRAVPSSSSLSLCNEDTEAYGDALLADIAAGRFEPVRVVLPNVPNDAYRAVRLVVADFELVAGARLAIGDERPVPYSCRWPAPRVGLSFRTINGVLTSLVRWGALEYVGDLPGRGKRGTRLYLPGGAA